MKALILAAGKGTRLRPLTDYIPKPMVPLHGRPLLEWILLYLLSYGIREYIIAVSYLADQIENYFGDGARWGVNIDYTCGEAPAGKAGEVWRAREFLRDESRFLVIPGDTICHMDYRGFMEFHDWYGGIASVAFSTQYRLEVGLAEVGNDGKILHFLEKTNLGRPVSTGAYILAKEIFPYIERFGPNGREVDLPGDVFPLLLQEGQPVYGFVRDYEWWDVGKINDYEAIARMPGEKALEIVCGPGCLPVSHTLGEANGYTI